MPVLFLTTRMRRCAGGAERVAVEGRTVRAALEEAERRHPGITEDLFEGSDLRAGITIAIDDTIVDAPLSRALEASSEIYSVPAMSGG